MTRYSIGSDERAVSEVIGVILMVAITVILAALVGGVVLSGAQTQTPTPQATFAYEYDAGTSTVTITHDGGDTYTTANTDEFQVLVAGTTTEWGSASWSSVAPVSTGDTYTVPATSGDVIQVVWVGPDRTRSHIVSQYTVP